MNSGFIIKDNNVKKNAYLQSYTADTIRLGKKKTAVLFDDECYAVVVTKALEERDEASSYNVERVSPKAERVAVKGTAVCLNSTYSIYGSVTRIWLIRSEEGTLYCTTSTAYEPIEQKDANGCYPVHIRGSVASSTGFITHLTHVKNI